MSSPTKVHTNILLGPPGTGKTTSLLNLVKEYLDKGVQPNEICYVAFTQKAASEAKERAAKAFGFTSEQMLWFRTIHSMAFKHLGLSTKDVLQRRHYSEICQKLGIAYSGFIDINEAVGGTLPGDRMLFMMGLAKARCRTLQEEYEASNSDISWYELKLLSDSVDAYKESHGFVDFNDMIERGIVIGRLPKFKVAFIDEAQDLSQLQWRFVNNIIRNSEVTYVAGDDDQSIFRWAGADTEHFIELPGTTRVLETGYRVPRKVLAGASAVLQHIGRRRPKNLNPRKPEHPADQGDIQYLTSLEDCELRHGSHLILARNAYLLKDAERHCWTEGYSYAGKNSPLASDEFKAIVGHTRMARGLATSEEERKLVKKFGGDRFDKPWFDVLKIDAETMEYFQAARQNGEQLTKEPRIRISTIHGAKGAEADHVVLYSDMAYRSWLDMQDNPDDEHRVFYVAMTRAKKTLTIISPKTNNSYQFPII